MYKITTKPGRTVRAKRPGDVVIMLRNKQITREDTIEDPELGAITVGKFLDEFEGVAETCATLEIMIDDIRELREQYKSWPVQKKRGQ